MPELDEVAWRKLPAVADGRPEWRYCQSTAQCSDAVSAAIAARRARKTERTELISIQSLCWGVAPTFTGGDACCPICEGTGSVQAGSKRRGGVDSCHRSKRFAAEVRRVVMKECGGEKWCAEDAGAEKPDVRAVATKLLSERLQEERRRCAQARASTGWIAAKRMEPPQRLFLTKEQFEVTKQLADRREAEYRKLASTRRQSGSSKPSERVPEENGAAGRSAAVKLGDGGKPVASKLRRRPCRLCQPAAFAAARSAAEPVQWSAVDRSSRSTRRSVCLPVALRDVLGARESLAATSQRMGSAPAEERVVDELRAVSRLRAR
eukprot:TRINITY_DN6042_c0_g1_i1.p2 TRINITY_DN6042_c0_g1~~TRINITY_DN6042_c0_g1_i1.p2  ORF type:complete len:343 (+),score=70.18 TRINITY_DN6042_c0_g1_i1:68-1030(+)